MGPHVHGPGDAEEIILVEKIALEDERVKAEIAKLNLPQGTVVLSDPWNYGTVIDASPLLKPTEFDQGRMVSMTPDACISASCT